jgi:hypothetical protein
VAYKNKADQAAAQARWYYTHRVAQRERVRKNNARYRVEHRRLIRALKSKPCKDCRKKYPYYVMDFDHVRGRKVANVGSMSGGWSKRAVMKEIAKCEVVCANCHRKRTHRRKTLRGRLAAKSPGS